MSVNGKPVPQNVTCAASPGDCVPTVDPVTLDGQTRLCRNDSDCAAPGTQLPDCCTGSANGQSTHFCFNHSYLSFISGVTCP
jgi:hypothetical protein